MRPLEGPCQWAAWRSVMLLVCLALFSLAARTAAVPMQDQAPVAVQSTATMADMPSMPTALDCTPCAVCYAAPTPSTNNFSAEHKEPEEPNWRANAEATPESAWRFDIGGWRTRWPARITFCRWLN